MPVTELLGQGHLSHDTSKRLVLYVGLKPTLSFFSAMPRAQRGTENGGPETGRAENGSCSLGLTGPPRLQFFNTVSHSLGTHTPSLHDSSSTADRVDNDDVPQPSFSTDAAANPATAASTSSSPEVAECCEVCLLVRRVSALWTVAFLFDVC